MAFSVRAYGMMAGRWNPFSRTAFFRLPSLIIVVILALAGCATSTPGPDRAPDRPPPSVHIPESTWWEVDTGITSASQAAAKVARNYAQGPMERWRERVRQRTEENFIPWYSSFWTQEWLALKVTWYKSNAQNPQDGNEAAVKRLAAYLQEQYTDRVLKPVAREVDPDQVREQATTLYLQTLRERLHAIARRYGIPEYEFDRWLKGIPAIALSSSPAHRASLYQVLLHADAASGLPAYASMMDVIRHNAQSVESGPMDPWMSPVARRANEKLAARLAVSGGASVAAAVFGGIPGLLISLGATGFGAAVGEKERPKMEALLRETLDAAVDDMWSGMMNDSARGVLAGVYYISEQVTGNIARTHTRPVKFESAPQGVPLPGEVLRDEKSVGEASAGQGPEYQ